VGALVPAQVDALAGARDPRQQGVEQLAFVTDQREHRTVVVRVHMHIENVCLTRERGAERVDRRTVAALREVRDRFER